MSGSGAASWVIIPNWGSRQHERMDGWIKDTITPPPLPPPAPSRVNSDPPHPPPCVCKSTTLQSVTVLFRRLPLLKCYRQRQRQDLLRENQTLFYQEASTQHVSGGNTREGWKTNTERVFLRETKLKSVLQ